MASESDRPFQKFMIEKLELWRESLLQKTYGDTISITAESIMSDEIIQRLATAKRRIRTEAGLKARIRWMFGGVLPEWPGKGVGEHGKALLEELGEVYAEYAAGRSGAVEDAEEEGEEGEEGNRKREEVTETHKKPITSSTA